MIAQIKPRRDTAANWTTRNPVLAAGEKGYETDTKRYKIGDGITAWNSLVYATDIAFASAVELEAGSEQRKPLAPNILRTFFTKRTKMPDGATAVYAQDDFTSHTWSTLGAAYGVISVVSKSLRVTAGSSGIFLRKTDMPGSIVGKTILLRVTSSAVTTISAKYWTTTWASFLSAIPVGIGTQIIPIRFPADAGVGTYFALESGLASGQTLDLNFCWIGDYSYLAGSLSEKAAAFANEGGDAPGVGVAASGTLTGNVATPILAGDTFTYAGKTYTIIPNGEIPDAEGEVQAGTTNGGTISNLWKGIIGDSASKGAAHFCTANPLGTASYPGSGQILYLSAISPGILGNQITISALAAAVSAGRITLSGSTLSGGYGAGAAKLSWLVARASQGLEAKTSIVDADEMLILDSVTGKIKKRLTYANFKATLLAADGNTDAGKAVQGNDSRLAVKGTWTPVFLGATTAGANTYSAQTGHYTRIGDHVFLTGVLTLSAKDVAMAGNMYIGGFPFNIGSGMGGGFSIGRHGGFNFSGVSGGALGASLDTGTNRAQLVVSPNNGGATQAIAPANVADTATIYFSLHYRRA